MKEDGEKRKPRHYRLGPWYDEEGKWKAYPNEEIACQLNNIANELALLNFTLQEKCNE